MKVDNGKIIFQLKYINLSYRYRGKVARVQINLNINAIGKAKYMTENFPIEKNKILVNILKNIIIMYSAIKIIANTPLLYSVLNPDTNSLSPSAKSNGVRFNSAKVDKTHIKNGINKKKKLNSFWNWLSFKNFIE